MDIYLPIAQISVNWLILLGMGVGVGLLSGMLGVSGGFIMTPLLIFYGIPPGVSVATQASPIAAASLAGAINKGNRQSVDYKMGLALIIGGTIGSLIGIALFRYLQRLGQVDVVVEASYVLLLGSVGGLMLNESVRTILAVRAGHTLPTHIPGQHTWIHGLPFKIRFRQSRIYISAIPIIALGFVVGIMTAILGTGGAFLLIPAKIYLLRIRTEIALGTSQFQIFVIACITTLMHAITDHTVDLVLAVILITGSTLGAQIGSNLASRLSGERLRFLFALLTLLIAANLLYELVHAPTDIYSVVLGA